MKIRCEQSDLFRGVDIVSKAVPIRTPMSILECILIDATGSSIKLMANDTEIGIETIVKGSIEEPGMIALNAKMFFSMVRSMPESELTIESDESQKTIIKSEKLKFDLMGKSGEEFSSLPPIEKNHCIEISQFNLKEMIRQTLFSVGDSEINKVMTGELFEINQNVLRVISMDGHRISIRKIELKSDYEDCKYVIPGKTLSEINKIITGSIDDVAKIYFSQHHAVFEFEDTTVMTRLLDGEYFDVNKMLSKEYSTHIKMNKKDLFNCVNRANLLVKESDKKPIIVNVSDGQMMISIQSSIGSLKEDIEIEKEGLDLRIGFNPKFFIDALRVIDDEMIDIYMDGSISPCFIKNANEDYIYLILPVNILSEN